MLDILQNILLVCNYSIIIASPKEKKRYLSLTAVLYIFMVWS